MKKGTQQKPLNPLLSTGAGGRNRTDTDRSPLDFESSASTSFTTPAFSQREASHLPEKLNLLIINYKKLTFACQDIR